MRIFDEQAVFSNLTSFGCVRIKHTDDDSDCSIQIFISDYQHLFLLFLKKIFGNVVGVFRSDLHCVDTVEE